jgi:outer membrane protein TolC
MLEISNYLWLEDNIPVELLPEIRPDLETFDKVDGALGTSSLDVASMDLNDHPKMRILENKYQIQQIEKRLKKNNLLPQVDLEHNFISQQIQSANSFNTANYKTGIKVNLPLFLRKERGELKLADVKLNTIAYDQISTRVTLRNKLDAINSEVASYAAQQELTSTIVTNYTQLLNAEERKFEMGESSLFLINSRESKLIEAKLKAIKIENESLNTKASLFEILNTQG